MNTEAILIFKTLESLIDKEDTFFEKIFARNWFHKLLF